MLSYGRSTGGTEAFDADAVPRMDRMTAAEREILANDNPAPI
jgi:hypothetical protein